MIHMHAQLTVLIASSERRWTLDFLSSIVDTARAPKGVYASRSRDSPGSIPRRPRCHSRELALVESAEGVENREAMFQHLTVWSLEAVDSSNSFDGFQHKSVMGSSCSVKLTGAVKKRGPVKSKKDCGRMKWHSLCLVERRSHTLSSEPRAQARRRFPKGFQATDEPELDRF